MHDRISETFNSVDEMPLWMRQAVREDVPFIDPEAFEESAFDTPAIARDKKRRRQIARKEMVEQGILPPTALLNTW